MMSFFDKFKLPWAKAAAPPVRQDRPLMHPEQVAQKQHHFPPDFKTFKYADSAIMTFDGRDVAGNKIYRRSLVARMVAQQITGEGVKTELEMFATLSELRAGGHPDVEEVAKILIAQHGSTMAGDTAPTVTTHASKPDMSGLDLYRKLNPTVPRETV